MSKWIMIGLILVLACVWVVFATVNPPGNQGDLQMEFFPGVEIEEIICFEVASGDIFWKCNPEQLNKTNKNSYSETSGVIGLGRFANGGHKAVISFNYNRLKNLLENTTARSLECPCATKNLKGEVLNYLSGFLQKQKAFL